jgi:hypothetical protein
MNVIFATGALRKFMNARARGASRQELAQLSAAAMAEQTTRPLPRRPDGGVVDLDRARLERSWESAPGD